MGIPLEISIQKFTGKLTRTTLRHPVPDTIPTYNVCPHCKTEVFGVRFVANGVVIGSYGCRRCSDVVPIRSAVRNPPHATDEIGTCRYCRQPESQHFVGCQRPRRAGERTDWSAA